MMDDLPKEYSYRHPLEIVLVFALFSGYATVMSFEKASHNDRGLRILRGKIQLSPREATNLYWGCGVLMGVGFLVSCRILYHRLTARQRIIFASESLILPISRWSSQEREIPYQHIKGMSVTEENRKRAIQIRHQGGIDMIHGSMLPTGTFEEVWMTLVQKTRENRPNELAPETSTEPTPSE
jgi:hypothetical protein